MKFSVTINGECTPEELEGLLMPNSKRNPPPPPPVPVNLNCEHDGKIDGCVIRCKKCEKALCTYERPKSACCSWKGRSVKLKKEFYEDYRSLQGKKFDVVEDKGDDVILNIGYQLFSKSILEIDEPQQIPK